jgi:ATP-grasp domain
MRVLLTGSRAPATLELARLCALAGHEVHVADTHRWDVCRGARCVTKRHRLPAPRASRSHYALALHEIVRRELIDVVVPTCEEVFHVAAIRDEIGARVACEPLERLAPLHDKWRFIGACDAAGTAVPRTYQLTQDTALDALPPGEYVVKPRYSRFATRVTRWRTGSAMPRQIDAQSGDWIVQEYRRGVSLCSWSVAAHGVVTAHAAYAADVTAGAMGAAISFHSIRHDAVLAWVRKFIAFHQLTGQFAFDFIETGNSLCAIECNPRLTSGIHCFRGRPDAVLALLDPESAHRHRSLEAPPGLHFRSQLAMLSYGRWPSPGESLLHANDDPWPRRLQLYTWLRMLISSALTGSGPRRWSTRDIEWNGE